MERRVELRTRTAATPASPPVSVPACSCRCRRARSPDRNREGRFRRVVRRPWPCSRRSACVSNFVRTDVSPPEPGRRHCPAHVSERQSWDIRRRYGESCGSAADRGITARHRITRAAWVPLRGVPRGAGFGTLLPADSAERRASYPTLTGGHRRAPGLPPPVRHKGWFCGVSHAVHTFLGNLRGWT